MPRQTLKQRPDGRYACKYQGKWFYGATQSEALAAREAYKRMLENGMKIESGQISVRDYVLRWLPIHKVDIRPGTYNAYAHYLDVMCQVIGDRLVRDVTPTEIKAVYGGYVGMSDSTIKKAASLYKAVFDTAVADGLCRTNPCKSDRAKPHKGTKGTHRAITDEERSLILTVEHRMRPAAMAMLYAGLRRGEAMALIIEKDVDFENKTISVHAATHYDNNQPIVEERTKTDAGRRTIPLFSPLAECLRGKTGYALPSAGGDLCSATAFRRGWDSYMLALSNAAGKAINIRAHDLRHSFCTMLRDAGVDLKIAIEWMGHADEKMILKIYDHVTPEREKKAVEFVELAVSSSQNGSQIALWHTEPVDL